MYIDTHCHLSSSDYDDIDLVIKENRDSLIDKIVISGCTMESIIESLDIAKNYSDVFVTIGFHPSEADTVTENDLEFLKHQLNNKKVVGIGEIGLDYHYGRDNEASQKKLFRQQLSIARYYDLPVVIHTRDATQDTIDILKEFPDVVGVIHCFNGSVEIALEYISMGYYLGIGGVLTFKNCNLYKVIDKIGLDHIVLETDSPYLTPVPFRGKKNSSKYIPYIASKIADILSISDNKVSQITYKNSISLFDLE